MKTQLKVGLFAALALAAAAFAVPQIVGAQGADHMTVEKDTDRPGGDYRNFIMEKSNANDCRKTCKADVQCRAYTYVKPGIQGPKARCWLKSVQPAPVPNECCESGIKEE